MARLAPLFLLLFMAGLLSACGRAEHDAMVATAAPEATEAAAEILREGGTAADAMVAAQAVLGLVEPQSSGLGGGAFALYFDMDSGLEAWDGRETAPRAAGPKLFLGADGAPMPFETASVGGRPVGVPGAVALLWAIHEKHGRLPWSRLFNTAIRLAEEGFTVSPRLAAAIADAPELAADDAAASLYLREEGGKRVPLPAGQVIRNPAYAETLRAIATGGPNAFYDGDIALAIIAAVNAHASNPGEMTAADLAGYRAIERKPLCRPYHAYRVCGMPPPTSGGLTSLMILGILQHYRMPDLRPRSPTAVHLLAEASRLAFADRDLYMADPDFVPVPGEGLLDRGYLLSRARLIDPGRDHGKAAPGDPAGVQGLPRAASAPQPEYGTSHFSIVDGDGNAVSLTTSVEQSFGARIMAAGFILNNELTDFSFLPEKDGKPVANRVEGGKRPRSSMSPTIVFDPSGDLFAVVGSPGGSRIIGYVTGTLLGLLDWKLDMQSAIDLPHVLNRNGATELEQGTALETLAPRLEAMGHKIELKDMPSGLQGIRLLDGVPDGGADRRREGTVIRIPTEK
ncbi:MAG: gamma-glutamyltransferase [Parvibaculaceae bacterium]